jgi:hypothetical protein
MLTRIGAALAGLLMLGAMLAMTVGGATLTLVALLAAASLQRRRGKRLGPIQGLLIAVITSSVILMLGFGLVLFRQPGLFAKERTAMAAAQRQPAPPPPAFLRALPGANVPPPVLPDNWLGPMIVVGLVMGCQVYGGLIGLMAWGGVWLLLYGVRGPPRPPIEETVPPVE